MVDIGSDGPPPVPQVPQGDRGSSDSGRDLFWFLLPLVVIFALFVAAVYVW